MFSLRHFFLQNVFRGGSAGANPRFHTIQNNDF